MGWRHVGPCQHVVQFYESDPELIATLDEFAGAGLEAGQAVLVIATEAHLNALEQKLAARRIDVSEARATDRYIPLNADKLFELLMTAGKFDSAVFFEIVGAALERCKSAGNGVRVFGEMVALLWAGKHYLTALQLEKRWKEQSLAGNFAVLCSYSWAFFATDDDARIIPDICAEHTDAVFR
jgi:hypothetical protein